MQNFRNKKILVFAPGTIGDTLLSLPAFSHLCKALRKQGNVIHLYNTYPETASSVHVQLYRNLELFDKMRFVPVATQLWRDPLRRFVNIMTLRSEHYDALIDIPNNDPDPLWLLRVFGAKKIYHDEGNIPKNYPRWKYLFDLFAQWGLPYTPSDLTFEWNFSVEEQKNADRWFESLKIPENRVPFAICTGGKCALQHWPLERYAEVLNTIVPEYHLFPVFFGGPGDVKDAEFLIRSCGCGIFASNSLTLREKILALKRCRFYLGNDTGVMHLAGAAGIGGVAVASARAFDHYWQPLSEKMNVVTADVPCKGCRNTVCRMGNPPPCMVEIYIETIKKCLIKVLDYSLGDNVNGIL